MNHIRNNIKDNFAQIPNALINDNTLSDRARFIFCYMAAKSDDWKFYQDKMAKDLKMSVDTVRKYIAELLESGWLTREAIRGEKGVFDSFIYDLHPSPCRKNAESVKNGVGKNPSPINSALTNTIPLQTKTITNKEEEKEEPQKENSILATVHDQVDETSVKVVEIIPSKPKKAKYIYPPTQEELIPLFYAKLQDKKRSHPQIIDCWNWANMEAEKFFLHWERKNWQIQKLGNAIATWVNGSITFGTVTKPCPIQYKGNPANAQPVKPTKVHVEQPKPSQQSIEERKAYFEAARAMLNSTGL